MPQCTATTQDGGRCRSNALHGSQFCFTHDPAHAQARAEARRRGGHNRRTPKRVDAVNALVSLRSVGDVQAQLESALADTLGQENSAARTQAVVRLLQVALKALEVGDLENRIALLETQLGNETGSGRLAA